MLQGMFHLPSCEMTKHLCLLRTAGLADVDADADALEVAAALAAAKQQAAAAGQRTRMAGNGSVHGKGPVNTDAFFAAMLKAEQAHERKAAAGGTAGGDKLDQLMAKKGKAQQVKGRSARGYQGVVCLMTCTLLRHGLVQVPADCVAGSFLMVNNVKLAAFAWMRRQGAPYQCATECQQGPVTTCRD